MGASEGSTLAVGDDGSGVVGMKRELSVEDLFDPLNRLDVRQPRAAAAPRSCKAPSSCVASTSPVAPIPEEADSGSVDRSSILSIDCLVEKRELTRGLRFEVAIYEDVSPIKCSSNNKSHGSDSLLQMQTTSTSDEDQHLVDNRKQRRMLSNRESARRSRLRKQQHLDELRAHVAQLRAENSQMLNSFNMASQQFAHITEENRQLRSEAMELSHQLQQLHHLAASQRAHNGLYHNSHLSTVIQGPQQ